MRVVVTGGSGKLGQFVVRELAEHGHDVVNVDRQPPPSAGQPGGFVAVDLTDYGQVLEAVSLVDERVPAPVDAVVHLAAIPAPGLRTNAATFANNATSSYNVFAAARAAGIRKVVWASSETVLGLPFDTPPPYIPVDEEYSPRPESTYSLVKTLEEEMARQFCRWDPDLTMVGLRFSNVIDPAEYATFGSFEDDRASRKWNLWAYIDGRDGAQAVRRALEFDHPGTEVFVIANADSVMTTSSRDLATEFFPGVEIRGDLDGNATMLGIGKARRLLGYEPAHSWRDGHSSSSTSSAAREAR